MDLTRLSFTKSYLRCITEEEAVFLLNFESILQEILTLHRLIIISTQNTVEGVERESANVQTMYFFRILASTLYESWKCLGQRKYKNLVSEYEQNLQPKAKNAFHDIQQYFSDDSNICKRIRNNFSYHYNYREIRNTYQKLSSDIKLDMYIHNSHGNSLYARSNMLINILSILEAYDIDDINEKLEDFIKNVTKVAKWFIILLDDIQVQIMDKVLAQSAMQIEDMTISDPPKLEDMKLNFFLQR